MKSIRIFTTAIVAFTLLLATTENSYGQIVPYKASGTNAGYSPGTGDYDGQGTGTNVGKHDNAGNVVLSDLVEVLDDGCLVFNFFIAEHRVTAANGDGFSLSAEGQVALCPIDPDDESTRYFAVWGGDFHVTENSGTGRFKNVGPANDPLTLLAVNDPFDFPVIDPEAIWTFSWEFNGKIDLGRRRGR